MIKIILALLFSLPSYATLNEVDKANVFNKNLLVNGGYESAKAKWTASGGTFATTTTSPMIGLVHATWDSGSAAQTLTSTAVAIPVGMYGRNGVATCLVTTPSGTATHTIEAYDGTNILSSVSIVSSTTPTRNSANFIFPSSGNISLRLKSVAADEPSVSIDDCYLGAAEGYNVGLVGQAEIYAALKLTPVTNCTPTTTSGAVADVASDSDCTTGLVASGAATVVSGEFRLRVPQLPPGKYEVIANWPLRARGASGTACEGYMKVSGAVTADLDYLQVAQEGAVVDGELDKTSMSGYFENTTGGTQSDVFFQWRRVGGAGNCALDFNQMGAPATITLKRFPLTSETAYRPDVYPWRVDANISGGNPDIGTSSRSSYTEIIDGSLTMTQNTGSIGVQIPCSTTNSSSGLTCSAGSESVGVVFNLPVAGSVLACASFGIEINNGAGGSWDGAFQIVETPNNAQTISQEGKSRVGTEHRVASQLLNHPLRVCGTFEFSSSGQKTLRLMNEVNISGTVTAATVLADASATQGQRDIHWEVYPVTQNTPMPLLVNSVVSSSPGVVKIVSALIANTGTPTISRQTGSWISSLTDNGTGDTTINITAGTFTVAPVCTCSAKGGAAQVCNFTNADLTTSAIRASTFTSNTGAASDNDFHIICTGVP
jgi:hypothetical protein